MTKVLNLSGPSYYECDICEDIAERILTDSFTGKDICFNCASNGEHGLFYEVTQSPESDFSDNLIEVATNAGLIPEEDKDGEDAGVCIYCHLDLTDDGLVLIDSTGGDACGVPLDNGFSDHAHCNGFAPDTWGSDPEICSGCHAHQELHPERKAA